MKILVTGATGFIGSHLAERLLQEGHQVRALVRPSSNQLFIKDLDLEVIQGDITNIEDVNRAVQGCEIVYHLATHRSRISAKKYLQVNNIQATENIATSVLKANVKRLVFAGSAGLYYSTIKNPPANEDTPPLPTSYYHRSKLLGENLLTQLYKKESLPIVTARITSTIGPRCSRWLNLCKTIGNKRFKLIGNGSNYDHLLYISDAVDGLIRCAQTPSIEGQSYLLAGREPTKIKEFVQIIAKEIGVDLPTGNIPKLPFQTFLFACKLLKATTTIELPLTGRYNMFFSNRILDISKARAELKFDPKVSTQEGMHHTIRWYREHNWL